MRIAWIAGLMLAAHLSAADVTVYVAVSPPVMVYPAECVARQMFRQADVNIVWRDGAPRPGPTAGVVLAVELADRTPSERSPDALAVSYPYSGASRGITIFYDRIRRRAGRDPNLERALLAHVLVHEITHVLQGIDRHSDTGVMKAHWDSADHAAMVRRPLPFEEEDLILIRQGRLLRDQQESVAARGNHEAVPAGSLPVRNGKQPSRSAQ